MRPSLRRAAVTLAVAGAFFAGLSVDHAARAARRDAGQPYRSLDVFGDVLDHVRTAYVEDVKEKELVYGAIDGMVARLDPHSQFMRPDAYRAFKEEVAGEFDGVGLELAARDEQLVVIAPIADSPADRAGIRPGDRVVKIDGTATREMPLGEAVRRMRGRAGTPLLLEVIREGGGAAQSYSLMRERVRTQSVEWRVADAERGHVVVRIKIFQERTDAELKRALDAARAKLAGPIRGLVLDLRNDPGGAFDQAVRVSDRFLTEGVIVSTEGRDKRNVEVEQAHAKDTEPNYPIIVLVNRGTASASEIVAGALQDHGRALIMGTLTFGKGSVQSMFDLEDGSGLKLTVARYYTPKHRSIQELGIAPDVVVGEVAPAPRADEGPAERDLERHFKNPDAAVPAVVPAGATTPAAAPAADHQLRTALDYLRAASILKVGVPSSPGPSPKR